jgi:4a-hydroxytetrahydrobiopterin dehydratase
VIACRRPSIPQEVFMKRLSESHCVPCRGGVPPLDDDQIKVHGDQVPDWQVIEKDGVQRITREFKFPDFSSALAFTVRVGEMADAEDHHPDIHLAWGRVRIEVWTHKIRGLHENDFILAAKTDALYPEAPA